MIYGIINSFLRAQRTERVLLLQVELVVKFPTGVQHRRTVSTTTLITHQTLSEALFLLCASNEQNSNKRHIMH